MLWVVCSGSNGYESLEAVRVMVMMIMAVENNNNDGNVIMEVTVG